MYPSLAYINKDLNAFCNSHLYRHIDLSRHPGRSVLLARTLIQSPRLRAYVRSYKFATEPPQRRMGALAEEKKAHFDALHQMAARTLAGAEALTLHAVPEAFSTKYPYVTRARLAPSLLVTSPLRYRMAANFGDKITHLELPDSFHGFRGALTPPTNSPQIDQFFRKEDLPNLKVVYAPLRAALRLIPGRKIETLLITLMSKEAFPEQADALSLLGPEEPHYIKKLGMRVAPDMLLDLCAVTTTMTGGLMFENLEVLAFDTLSLGWTEAVNSVTGAVFLIVSPYILRKTTHVELTVR